MTSKEALERSYKRLEFVYKNECEDYDKMISDINYNYGVAKLLIDTLQEENSKYKNAIDKVNKLPDCDICDANWHNGCMCLKNKIKEVLNYE